MYKIQILKLYVIKFNHDIVCNLHLFLFEREMIYIYIYIYFFFPFEYEKEMILIHDIMQYLLWKFPSKQIHADRDDNPTPPSPSSSSPHPSLL